MQRLDCNSVQYLLVPQGSGAKMGTVVGLLTMPGDHDSTKGWFRRLI
jgi:hypothetical protein